MMKLSRLADKYYEPVVVITLYVIGAILFLILKISGVETTSLPFFTGQTLFPYALGNAFLGGLITGISVWLLEVKFFSKVERHINHLWLLIIRFVFLSVIIISTAYITHFIFALTSSSSVNFANQQAWLFIKSGVFFSLFVYLFLFSFMIHFSRQVSQNIGHNVIINYLLGKYREPQEEVRSFMFVDLNNSTEIAERMGHSKYSEFLSNFFDDFTSMIEEYPVELYQFVGDEIVITWKTKPNKEPVGVIIFEHFESIIKLRKEFYLNQFGEVPEFKAAINSGLSIMREVGTNRREVVYHGDVLNTCARILGQCKKLGKGLLISEDYLLTVNTSEYCFDKISEVVLRGKNQRTSIYGLINCI